MPVYKELPDGTIGAFPDGMSEDEIAEILIEQYPSSGLTRTAQDFRIGDPEQPPGRVEKLLGGAKHEWDKVSLNLKKLFTELTPEDRQLLEQGSAFQDEAGGWATGGAMAADTLATAPIGGPVMKGLNKVGGKLLPRAMEAMSRGGLAGGRLTGGGIAARGAIEGGAAGAMFSDPNAETQGHDAIMGAGIGAALPLALTKGGAAIAGLPMEGWFPGGWAAGPAGFHAISDALAGSMSKSQTSAKRLRKALGQNVGEGQLDLLGEMVANAAPGAYPQTPAAVTGSHGLAQLESQARKRSPSLFQEHDTQVAEQAFRDLMEGTASADLFDNEWGQAAQAVRNKFVMPGTNTPITPSVVETPSGPLPDMEPSVLRQALSQQGSRLEQGEAAHLGDLAAELGSQKLHKTVPAGEPTDFYALRPPAAAAFSRIGGTRAVIDALYRRADRITKQQIDQALANPVDFVRAVQMKSQTDPLTPVEETLLQVILYPAHTMSAGQSPMDLRREQATYGER